MLDLLVAPIIEIYRWSLTPIAPFSWFGYGISTLDVVATFRLCIILRQLREQIYRDHVRTKGKNEVENASFVKNLTTTLTVVYGGEAVMGMCIFGSSRVRRLTPRYPVAPLLGAPPSFIVSGIVPALYTAGQAAVDALPAVPELAAWHELPLSLVDGITRAYLLCNLIPPSVVQHPSTVLSNSPWTLLLTSLVPYPLYLSGYVG